MKDPKLTKISSNPATKMFSFSEINLVSVKSENAESGMTQKVSAQVNWNRQAVEYFILKVKIDLSF